MKKIASVLLILLILSSCGSPPPFLNRQPLQPSNPFPTNGASNVPVDVTLSWSCSDPDGDTLKYDIYFGVDPTPPLVEKDHPTNSWNPGILEYDTTYYWKVVAKDGKGGETSGPVWYFTTESTPTYTLTVTTIPEEGLSIEIDGKTFTSPKTILVEKGNHTVRVLSPQYKDKSNWVSGDDTEYVFDRWSDGNAQNPRNVYINGDAAYTALMSVSYYVDFEIVGEGSLNRNDGYYASGANISVEAQPDSGYNFDHWEINGQVYRNNPISIVVNEPKRVVAYFTKENRPPEVPSNPNPPDGLVDVSINITLSWDCNDPDGDTLAYDIYFGTSDPPPLVVNNHPTNSYDPGTLQYNTTYHWKVVAKDGKGGETSGPIWHFTTRKQPGTPPEAPSNLVAETLSSTQIKLTWQDNSDNETGFKIERKMGESGTWNQITTVSSNVTTYTDTGLTPDTTYYYRVKAYNSYGDSDYSNIAYATTLSTNRPPNIPSNPNPPDGATEVTTDATLSWSCSDPDGDILMYDVYFGTDSTPSLATSSILTNSYDPGTLSYSTTYYWKIVAKDGKGGVTEGPIWSFTTQGTPQHTLTVTTSPETGLAIKIDGVSYTSPKSLEVEKGNHTIEVITPQYKDNSTWVFGNDTRYEFDEWDDGSKDNPRGVYVDKDVTYTAGMVVSYYVDFEVEGGGSIDKSDGYYGSGSSILVTANSSSGYTFDHWEVNGNIFYNNPLSLIIDEPKYVKAVFSALAPGSVNGYVNLWTGGYIPQAPGVSMKFVESIEISKIPEKRYREGEVVVGIENISIKDARKFFEKNLSYDVKDDFRTEDDSLKVLLLKVKEDPVKVSAELSKLPWVSFAEPNYIYGMHFTPNDPYYSYQWHYDIINLPAAWNETTGDNNIVVAVLDTGVDLNHPDLKDSLVDGWDFVDNDSQPMDENGHGTHVAGTIAAVTNNLTGVAGVNWGGTLGTKIMPLRVLDADGIGSTYDIAKAIVYATEHGAKVINMSLGGDSPSTLVEQAADYAYYNGVVLVASSGNESANTISYPAAHDSVIAVGAVRYDKQLAYYSNYGPEQELVAPGGDMTVDQNGDGYQDGVYSTYYATSTSQSTYRFSQGTSMAAPHVSGVVALLMARGFTEPNEIRQILRNTAEDLGDPGFDEYYGYGLVNPYDALTYQSGWEPFMVWVEDASHTILATGCVDSTGQYDIQNVPPGNVYIYAWWDFDHSDNVSKGDYYGYYGFNGDPNDPPQPVSITPEGSVTVDFSVAVVVDDSQRPTLSPVLLEYKKHLIEEHYKRLKGD